MALERARGLLAAVPGVVVADPDEDGHYPTPVTHSAKRDAVFVARLREMSGRQRVRLAHCCRVRARFANAPSERRSHRYAERKYAGRTPTLKRHASDRRRAWSKLDSLRRKVSVMLVATHVCYLLRCCYRTVSGRAGGPKPAAPRFARLLLRRESPG